MIESINLNLIPSGVSPVCHVSQYDAGRQIKINLFEGINPYTILSGDTFTLNVRKPDNTIVTTTVSGTQGNNYITISTTEQIAAVVGENLCELKITNGSTVIGTLNFIMQVERDVLSDGIPSQSVIEDLDERIAEAIGDNYYNKTETDALLALKADKTEFYNFYPTEQESGAIAHFTDGAENIPVKSLVSQIVAVESGSGEKSPDNPYTISGFDSGVVSVCGVNVWNEDWELGAIRGSDGADVEASTQIRSVGYTRVKPNTSYRAVPTSTINVFFYDANKNYIDYIPFSSLSTFTTPANCYFVRLATKSGYGTTYNNNISINYPSTDTQYHAYNGNTYTFTFGQTVYGGHFDNKGNLVVTNGFSIYDGSENWVYQAPNTFRLVIPTGAKPATVPKNCNMFTPSLSGADDTIFFGSANMVITSAYFGGDINAFKSFLSTNNLKIGYELVNTITLAITSQDIPTLSGENNIFSNTGDVDVTIRADIGLYIDKRLNASRSTPNNLIRAAAYVNDPESVNETQEDNVEPQVDTQENNDER